jgi:peroxiredoxin Q/BCP
VSPDPVGRHAKFVAALGLPYRLLADTKKEAARKYGVLKEKTMFGRKVHGVERSTFVIDEHGRLEQCMYGVSAKGHAEDVVACMRP